MTDTTPLPYLGFEYWSKTCWQTATRYYVAEIMQDLFGTWVLRRSWGGRGSRAGNSKIVVATDYEHAVQLLETVAKQRKARGYIRSE